MRYSEFPNCGIDLIPLIYLLLHLCLVFPVCECLTEPGSNMVQVYEQSFTPPCVKLVWSYRLCVWNIKRPLSWLRGANRALNPEPWADPLLVDPAAEQEVSRPDWTSALSLAGRRKKQVRADGQLWSAEASHRHWRYDSSLTPARCSSDWAPGCEDTHLVESISTFPFERLR